MSSTAVSRGKERSFEQVWLLQSQGITVRSTEESHAAKALHAILTAPFIVLVGLNAAMLRKSCSMSYNLSSIFLSSKSKLKIKITTSKVYPRNYSIKYIL